MAKRLLAIIILIFVCFSLCAEDFCPSTEELSEALSVVMDCLSATLAASYSQSNIALPSCTVSLFQESDLPSRIAFFLADPDEILRTLGKNIGIQNNLFSAFISLLQKTQQDPLLSAVYLSMSRHGYDNSDYLLSGYINFSYPDEITLEDIVKFLMSRDYVESTIALDINLTIRGLKSGHSVNIAGQFAMNADTDGSIVVSAIQPYLINGYTFTGGKFLF